MKKDQLQDLHWLLLMAKRDLRYVEQREKWNALQRDFRGKNKGLRKINDLTGFPLSLTEGIYQD